MYMLLNNHELLKSDGSNLITLLTNDTLMNQKDHIGSFSHTCSLAAAALIWLRRLLACNGSYPITLHSGACTYIRN